MAVFELQDVCFVYAGQEQNVINHLSFSVDEGSFVLLFGPSGGGKSTLLRLMKHMIAPAGRKTGQILYQNRPVQEVAAQRLASEVGFVFQNVDSQLVSDHVEQELAFGLEQLGLPARAISSKIAETASFFGMERFWERRTDELSGGEKQLLNLACVMVADPRVLLLDEPLSQLDPIARLDFLSQLRRINRDLGVTVILSEHQLDDVYGFADKVLVLEKGRGVFCGGKQAAAEFLWRSESPMRRALPASLRLTRHVGITSTLAWDVRRARNELQRPGLKLRTRDCEQRNVKGKPVLQCNEVTFGYERSKMVLSDLSLKLRSGECLGVIGGNGSGKSTLLHLLAGNRRPLAGKIVRVKGRVGYLPQNPYQSFIRDTLRSDIQGMLHRRGLAESRLEEGLKSDAFFASLEELMEKNPLDLSGGEAQKAALLKLLLAEGDILLLDEPTKGLDSAAKEELLCLLQRLNEKGKSVVLVSHDLEFIARCADRCLMLFRGEIAAGGTPRELFFANHFYTTTVRKITRGLTEGAVIEEDVEAVWE